MSNPKISIIIPLYNQYKKLLECLDSIKKQTFQDFEIIVVNDGSIDVQHEILCKNIMCIISGVKCVYQKNQGAPSARNHGFKESCGQYVIFCDADVVMRSDMLEKMNRVLDENPKISYTYSSFKFGFKKFRLWKFDAKRLRKMPYIHTTSLMRRDHFLGWDESLKRLQDWDLYLTMLDKAYIGEWINEILFKIKTGGTISRWLPSFFIKLGIGKQVKKYNQAKQYIVNKHF